MLMAIVEACGYYRKSLPDDLNEKIGYWLNFDWHNKENNK
jgi:hypothetical protein